VANRWEATQVEGARVEWMPIVALAPGTALGLSRAGEWLVGGDDDCLPLTSPRAGVRLLVLLERGQLRVRTQLLDCLATTTPAFDPHPDLEVPIAAAIRACLGSGMPYWASLALDWLAVSPSAGPFDALLQDVSKAGWATQAIRHRANRLRR
jgi:hypothetical protein